MLDLAFINGWGDFLFGEVIFWEAVSAEGMVIGVPSL